MLSPVAERLAEAGVESSVGTAGDSYDNALAEPAIGLYKTELIRQRGPWRHLEAVEYATLEWVHWFNHRRLPRPIGDVPPAENESAHYRQQEGSAMAARLKRKSLRESRCGSPIAVGKWIFPSVRFFTEKVISLGYLFRAQILRTRERNRAMDMPKTIILAAVLAATSGCATLTSDAHVPVALSFSDGSDGECRLQNKRGTWETEIPGTPMIRRSDDQLVYRCETEDGREAEGMIASTVGAKIVASAVFIDFGITDAITDKHREYPSSFVIPVKKAKDSMESTAGI